MVGYSLSAGEKEPVIDTLSTANGDNRYTLD